MKNPAYRQPLNLLKCADCRTAYPAPANPPLWTLGWFAKACCKVVLIVFFMTICLIADRQTDI